MNISSSIALPISLKLTLFKKASFIKIILIFALVLLLFLSISYIFQVNAETSERYLVSSYERQISEVLKGKESLELILIQNNSLKNAFSALESENSGFVRPEKINHLRVVGNRVVSR